MSLYPRDRDLSQPPERVELRVRASDFRITVEELELRLDTFLAHHLSWRSRTSVQALIREGFVFVDAATPDQPQGTGSEQLERRPGRRLVHGSRVVVVIPEALRLKATEAGSASGDDALCILYEDDEVLAVDKPPMMAVHPSGRHLSGTLIQRVHARYRAQPGERVPIRLCHRLDRETSGIVLLAKDPISHPKIMAQFEDREVEKHYLALVHGTPERDSGVIDLPIGQARASTVGLKMAVREDGQQSRTDWFVLERRTRCSLLRCRIHTGRQHQIRVHMEAIGHPLIGDKLYGSDDAHFLNASQRDLNSDELAELELPRHALHSHRLIFTAPRSQKRIEIESQLAPDLAVWFAKQP